MHLSPRHAQILSMIAEGYSDKEIARDLGMSDRTVASHLQRLYQRHGVHSRAAIVARWLTGRTRFLADASGAPTVRP
jgi:LuxR family maltose regulon positive regulatory protein/two-component system response regulator NreC